MKDKLLKIFQLPSVAKVGILVGTIALIGGGFYFMSMQAAFEEVSAIKAENETLRSDITTKTKIVANIKYYEERVDLLNVELDKALKELPNQRELDNLLAGISDKAKESGLDIKLFRPRGERKKGFYAEVPVNLTVSGTYHEVATFFDEVAHLERVVNLENISMSKPQIMGDGVVVETSVLITGYRFLENFIQQREQERKKREAEKSGKKKKRRK